MVASARVAYLSKRSKDYGLRFNEAEAVQVNMEIVRQRKRDIVSSFRGGSEGRLKTTENLDLIMGQARFVAAKEIEVVVDGGQSESLTAESIFINVGGRPAPLDISVPSSIKVLDSTSIMELGEVPEHLVVIGGGYIGLEFAQMFRRFGSKVTVIHRGKQLLSREDADVAKAMENILREDGLEILLNAKASGFDADGSALKVTVNGVEQQLKPTHILGAAGRIPNTDKLDVAKAGIDMDKHNFVIINDRLETNVPGIYALGDVKGGPAFTHISYDDFRILQANVLSKGNASIANRLVPYTVYTDPQLGRVGLTEAEARNKGLNIKVAKMPMAWVARALEMDESRGLMKAIVDKDTGLILGAAILGIEGGELMSMLQIAMMGGLRYEALAGAVFAHPTLAESLNNLWGNFEE